MNTAFKRFSIKVLILSLILSILSFFMYHLFPAWITINWPYLMVFFIIVNLILYKLSDKAKQKDMTKFSTVFIGTSFLKLLLYFAIIFFYSLLNKEDAIPFLITFFVYYVIYTIVEVVSITKN
ncbi:MAG: hypothetical protein LBM67_08795 [Lentimicrobiaceae bacterium]|jgi:hypothetical protein|nr:hypothetical protein [Lentimicrobiaceae bacterium]